MTDLLIGFLLALSIALGSLTPSPSPQPEAAGAVGTALVAGYAGWATPSLGSRYLATRFPRGTRVRICGAACVVMTTNDYGPDPRIKPTRVADIAVGYWRKVCGLPPSRGLCYVEIETWPDAPDLPRTDTE